MEDEAVEVPTDPSALLEFGLPLNWKVPFEAAQVNNTIYFVSSSPHFRSVTTRVHEDGHLAVEANEHINLIQLARAAGRCYARNGHNRLYQAVRQGIPEVPALILDCSDARAAAVQLGVAGFDIGELASLERPPTVEDFLTDVAVTVPIRERRIGFSCRMEFYPLNLPI